MEKENYKNWFVLQVKTGREQNIKEYIEKNTGEQVAMRIFYRELLFDRQKKEKKVISLLFPGYIFVHNKVKCAVDVICHCFANEFIKPICFKQKKCSTCFTQNSPCMVFEHEMAYLLRNSDAGGVFRISRGIIVDEKVMIAEGPLRNTCGDIIWLNEKKKKVCVEISLFNRPVRINLGLSMLDAQAG
jgi:transcriptional antiterminator NusG